MACFLVPMAEAIVITVVKKRLEKKEIGLNTDSDDKRKSNSTKGLSWSKKLSWLNKMLWGGTALLAFEHIWHGEIVPWPPFLTAMYNPANLIPLLQEIAIFGTSMAIFITLVWGIIVLIADIKAKKEIIKTQINL